MQTNQMTKVLAGAAMCVVLWTDTAGAGEVSPAGAGCPGSAPGLSLCGKVGTALHTCVQERSCDKRAAPRKRSKGGLGFLSRLFI